MCSALAVLAAAAGVTCAVLASAAAVDSAAAAVGRKGLMPPDPSKHLPKYTQQPDHVLRCWQAPHAPARRSAGSGGWNRFTEGGADEGLPETRMPAVRETPSADFSEPSSRVPVQVTERLYVLLLGL